MLFHILASAGLTMAANSCSFSKTISEAATISSMNSCPTLSGDFVVTGDELAAVDLSSVEVISGDVSFHNSSSITDINLGGISNITGSVDFSALTQLHSIEFNQLTSAKQLSFISLPSLASLNLGSGLANVSSLTLSDTAVSSIDNLLQFKTIDVLNVNNNKNITSVDLSGLQSVTQGLTISFNSDNATVRLENLKSAANLTIQDVGELEISSLEYVNGSFILGYNSFSDVSFDALTNVGASIQIFANDELETLGLNNLTEIDGEFRIFNNSLLSTIDLKNLETVKGAVSLTGEFGNFTMDSLKEVDGDFSIESTSEDFSCDVFNKLHKSNKIKGHNYNCSSPSTTQTSSSSKKTGSSGSSSGSNSSSSSGSGSSSSSSSTKSSAAAYLNPQMAFAVIVAGVLALVV